MSRAKKIRSHQERSAARRKWVVELSETTPPERIIQFSAETRGIQ